MSTGTQAHAAKVDSQTDDQSPTIDDFVTTLRNIQDRIDVNGGNGPVVVAGSEFDLIRRFEASALRKRFGSELSEITDEAFRGMLQFAGDSAFTGWPGQEFLIEGRAGVHVGADINYYYQGFLTAAADRSPRTMIGYITAYNLRQALRRPSWYDIRQIGPARRWAYDGYWFYKNNVGDRND